ncbi:MAG: Rieske 2Fe-2S domain-containing protein [Azospirillaceae bacterium]
MTAPEGAPRAALFRLAGIPDGTARGAVLGEGTARLEVLVHRSGNTVRAYENRCPHLGTPLDWVPDRFMSADGRHLQCATHGAIFRIADGFCLAGPCAGARLRALTVAVRDGWVCLADG